jgi:hypothetical protein
MVISLQEERMAFFDRPERFLPQARAVGGDCFTTY